jgi:L-2,4-diaminobutyrate transaminase
MCAAAQTALLQQLDRQHLLHPFTDLSAHQATGGTIMSRAAGVRIWDTSGRDYIDGLAGLWCVNVGYGRREIRDAVAQQIESLAYYHAFNGMASEPSVRLAARLAGMAPEGLNKVFFGMSGSDANDTAIKIVRYFWNAQGQSKRKKIIARRRAYHGVSLAAASLTGLASSHHGFDLPEAWAVHVTPPYRYRESAETESAYEFVERLAAELEETIAREGADTIGAFIAEPVQGAGGVIIPPDGYFQAVQPILRRHDILLIADEVICGFGRLGHMFGSRKFGIEPDILTLAKGITSGYVPLSATLVTDAVWEALRQGSDQYGNFGHGYTYSAHPVAAAAALANLDILEQEQLTERAARLGPVLERALTDRLGQHPLVGEIRCTGLIAGVELVADRATRRAFEPRIKAAARVAKAAMDRRLITRALPNADILALSPPLIIDECDIQEIASRLEAAVNEVADALTAEGSWSPNPC